MKSFYDEKEQNFIYPVRCDKHNLAVYEYCEMCWVRSNIKYFTENISKIFQEHCGQLSLSVHVESKRIDRLEKLIEDLKQR